MNTSEMSISGEQFPTEIVPAGLCPDAFAARARSVNVSWCLFLIYYFSFSDFVLKFFPQSVAIALRYFPELLVYLLAACLLVKKFRVVSFPLFWPLVFCAVTMTISGILNSSPITGVLGDFRSYFRFSAFSYVMWRTVITPRRIEQFVNGFLGLTIVQLIIGGLELIGGPPVKIFFAPALGWETGTPAVLSSSGSGQGSWLVDQGSWLSGTLSNYNDYGMFMTISCVLALAMYFARKSSSYRWIAIASALAVVLSISRHALLLLIVAALALFIFHRREVKVVACLRWATAVLAAGCVVFFLSGGVNSVIAQRVASIANPAVVEGSPTENIRLYMTLVLPPRFLASYPFFGQGPIPPSDEAPTGPFDPSQGPTLKAAPELPGWVTAFVRDVVWVLILGLYGILGVMAFFFVFWTVAKKAREVRKNTDIPEAAAIAEACIVAVVVFLLGGFFSLEIIARDTIPAFWTLAGIVLSVYSSLSLAPEAEKRRNEKRHRFRFAAITANTAPGTSSQ
jgi:hypothetical protein